MVLTLPIKSEYFNQIKSGEKLEEYRLYNDFWKKRIEGKPFESILITKGYPKKNDHERRLKRPWKGYEIKEIIHQHFGKDPVKVFAIKVN